MMSIIYIKVLLYRTWINSCEWRVFLVFKNYFICLLYKLYFLQFFSKSKTKEDMLFELPENLKVLSKNKKTEDMLSNQMLSGIPEVDLGIE